MADRLTTTQEMAATDESPSTARRLGPPVSASEMQAGPADLWGNRSLTEKLWQSRIVAPDPNEDAENRLALARLVEQVRSVQFEPREQPPRFSLPAEFNQPAQPSAVVHKREDNEDGIAEPESASPPVLETEPPAETTGVLVHLVQNPDRVEDPLELAELLFLNDQRAQAAVFYQKALDLLDTDVATAREEQAWILFQLANCLRETDVAQAKDAYVKLIAEYPDSPWTEIAKAQGRLITWYQQARPSQLVDGPKP